MFRDSWTEIIHAGMTMLSALHFLSYEKTPGKRQGIFDK